MELHDILIRPVVTEKSTTRLGSDRTYAFQVGDSANKHQIKDAVEAYFKVSVESVRTLRVRGKRKRFGRHYGKRSNWKKAYVTLVEGDSIQLFEE